MSRRGHRFFLSEPLSVGSRLSLPLDKSKQIANVLRLRPDDHVTLFNGDGMEYDATLREVGRGQVVAEIRAIETGTRWSDPPVELALSMIKSDRFEWALQKTTELGIHRLIPMNAERGVISLRVDRKERRRERWMKIATEAAEQSGRTDVPRIDEIQTFDDVIAPGDARVVVLWEDEEAVYLPEIALDNDRPVRLIVGPEGGFTGDEIEKAIQAGATTASLGPLTLRSETAAVAAVTILAARAYSKSN